MKKKRNIEGSKKALKEIQQNIFMTLVQTKFLKREKTTQGIDNNIIKVNGSTF